MSSFIRAPLFRAWFLLWGIPLAVFLAITLILMVIQRGPKETNEALERL